MQQKITLKILPSEAADEIAIKHLIATTTGRDFTAVTGYHIQKKSIDARGKISAGGCGNQVLNSNLIRCF